MTSRLMSLMTFLRLRDGEGLISFTGLAFYFGGTATVICMVRGLPVSIPALTFLAGFSGHFLKKGLNSAAGGAVLDAQVASSEHSRDVKVAEVQAAAAVDSARIATDAVELKGQVAQLAKAVVDLATPERQQAVASMLGRAPAKVPEGFRGL